MLQLAMALLKARTQVDGGKEATMSDTFDQEEGLTTGAPAAPILFVAVMGFFLEAVRRLERDTYAWNNWVEVEEQLLILREIVYADDMNFLVINEALAQIRIHIIEKWGPTVGLTLEPTKCKRMLLTQDVKATRGESVREGSRVAKCVNVEIGGKQMEEVKKLKVLGGGISRETGFMHEIRRLEGLLLTRRKELDKILKGTGISRKRRWRLIDSLLGSKFKFNLDTATLTPGEEARIDALQSRVLRICYKLQAVWIRGQKAVRVRDIRKDNNIRPWSTDVRERRWNMFKKVVKLPEGHPNRRVIWPGHREWNPQEEKAPTCWWLHRRGEWLDTIAWEADMSTHRLVEEIDHNEDCWKNTVRVTRIKVEDELRTWTNTIPEMEKCCGETYRTLREEQKDRLRIMSKANKRDQDGWEVPLGLDGRVDEKGFRGYGEPEEEEPEEVETQEGEGGAPHLVGGGLTRKEMGMEEQEEIMSPHGMDSE
jgi:hypothetical protein